MKSECTIRRQASIALEALKESKSTNDVAAEFGVDVVDLESWKAEVIAALKSFGAGGTLFEERLPKKARSKTERPQSRRTLAKVLPFKTLSYLGSTNRLSRTAGYQELA